MVFVVVNGMVFVVVNGMVYVVVNGMVFVVVNGMILYADLSGRQASHGGKISPHT